jgi:uncharacterized protein YrrD
MEEMRIAQEMLNKPVISVKEGKKIGTAQDFFVDRAMTQVSAIYLGSDGLFNRTEMFIKWPDVVTLGEDAILVEKADCLLEVSEFSNAERYVRRDDISGRRIDTPGGTSIGHVGDIIVDQKARIVGFSLPQVYVSGPIATNKAISRSSVVDTGDESGVLTANLAEAEKTNLQVSYQGLLAEPVVSPAIDD